MTESRNRQSPETPCPVCRKPATPAYHPFCTKRCSDIDLGRWLQGTHIIPGRAIGLGDEDDEPI